jgi:hypothetical protein
MSYAFYAGMIDLSRAQCYKSLHGQMFEIR